MENKKNLDELSRAYASGEVDIPIKPSGEEGVKQIKALLGLGDIITNVNLPNKGQIDTSHDIVAETNALFSKDSVKSVVAGKIPDGIALLMDRHMHNQEMLLKAALERDTKQAFHVFRNDPSMAKLSPLQAKDLFCEMFEKTKNYLPDYAPLE